MNRKRLKAGCLERVGSHFGLRGDFAEGTSWGSGHINDTFCVAYDQAGKRVRYIHQRLNTEVFGDPAALMRNVERVCDHIAGKTARAASKEGELRRALRLIRARDGNPFWVDAAGDCWRTFAYIEGAITRDVIKTVDEAHEVAKEFGRFQAMLSDFPVDGLVEIIPDFHNTRKRLEALKSVIEDDPVGRVSRAGFEIDFVISREPLARILLDLYDSGDIPLRITHNDTKSNNVLLDARTGEGICVIDLDTVMPGCSLYDFGDLVRTAVSPTVEDERDLDKIRVRPGIFEALAQGFFSTAGAFLNDIERDHMVMAGMVISYESGIRFLTDFIGGDHYFKTTRDDQNLDRCRAQFALVRSLGKQERELRAIVARLHG